MSISVTEMFTVGIGPSSSHTVGPMRASKQFLAYLDSHSDITTCQRIQVELYGSLAHTGLGHGTDYAIMMGLLGLQPSTVVPQLGRQRVDNLMHQQSLSLTDDHHIHFDQKRDLHLNINTLLPGHSNGMKFSAFDEQGELILERSYYSIGGGFIQDEEQFSKPALTDQKVSVKYPFSTAKELAQICYDTGLSISQVVLANEASWRDEQETKDYLMNIWQTMKACIQQGCETEGILPGGLRVKRRAAQLYRKLSSSTETPVDPLSVMDWVNLFALAVNEENAAGERVVTAPTNGAAGIIPAVMSYFEHFKAPLTEDTAVRFLLKAGAIGMLFKTNASISGAEVGCQGEVGVACSMAAAGLVEILGGNVEQCQVAAEIAMEHNLGLTCDPVGGLVQIPCIERNAMASVKAINAARLSFHGDGSHKVSLDEVIKTMMDTGRDMGKQYKETALGGLAVNIIEC